MKIFVVNLCEGNKYKLKYNIQNSNFIILEVSNLNKKIWK